MLKYFLKISIRHLRAHKVYSLINLLGLSLGLAACFVILVYCYFQMSYDRYNEQLDNIYLVTLEKPSFGWIEPWSPLPLATTIKREIPEVKETARWKRLMGSMKYKDKIFSESSFTFSDPDIFTILTLPLVEGSLNSILFTKDFVVISKSMAEKYFGGSNPIGESVVVLCAGETYNLTVAAVMKDIPPNSTFKTDAIGPLEVAERFSAKIWKRSLSDLSLSWDIQSVTTYVLLNGSARPDDVSRKLLETTSSHQDASRRVLYHLYPLSEVYFHSSTMVNNVFRTGNITDLYIYSSAAFLLLFIACVNYLLLNLGRASLRTKEIGVRKVFGARKADLFLQLITEATVLALLALPLAILFVEVSLQNLSDLLGTRIDSRYFHSWQFILGFLAIALVVAVIAGSYVSLYLSRFTPIDTLRNTSPVGSSKVILRRILMATQMVIFIGLTFSSITIYKQLMLLQHGDMGFDPSNVIYLYPDVDEFGKSFEAFRNELKQLPVVLNVSAGNILPGSESRGVSRFPRKDNPAQLVTVEGMLVEREFIEAMGMKMVAGVSFLERKTDQPKRICIVNETAVRELGLSNPIGEEIGGNTIIGVVHDFNLHSLREAIPAINMTTGSEYLREVAVRVSAEGVSPNIKGIEEISRKFNDGRPMEWESFDQRLEWLYTQERKFARAIGYAAGVAILVGCLGILGMSLFVCQQRVKEIGIRKVLGASTGSVYYMVTREFLALIVLSAVIAFPFAHYAVNLWLQRFAYHAESSMWDILLGILFDIVIVLGTVSVQAVRAARANPVKSIRYE